MARSAGGVVAGRAGHHEGHPFAAPPQRLDGGQPGAGGTPGGGPRVGGGEGVRIEFAPAGPAEGGQTAKVAGCVHPGQVLELGRPGRQQLEVPAKVQVVDAGHHRTDPGRAFGVAREVVLGGTDGPADDQHGRLVLAGPGRG